tara:strand:+ start:343 stop:966 length:624 start_codon:yes stop_codon:yes gene_type:complete
MKFKLISKTNQSLYKKIQNYTPFCNDKDTEINQLDQNIIFNKQNKYKILFNQKVDPIKDSQQSSNETQHTYLETYKEKKNSSTNDTNEHHLSSMFNPISQGLKQNSTENLSIPNSESSNSIQSISSNSSQENLHTYLNRYERQSPIDLPTENNLKVRKNFDKIRKNLIRLIKEKNLIELEQDLQDGKTAFDRAPFLKDYIKELKTKF